MTVALLRGENFRLYRTLELEPHPQLNLIVGGNASGKTTALESLYVPARGRSFRANNLSELCGAHGNGWTVFLDTRGPTGMNGHRLGMGWDREGVRLKLDEATGTRMADVIRAVPLQWIDPLAHKLLDEGPAYRRSYIDWGVFHVEHRFLEVWRRFQRALQQRNRALRDQADPRSVNAFNEELATTADAITRYREQHVAQTTPGLVRWAEALLGDPGVRTSFQRGWPADEDYRETLVRNLEQHQRLGTTVQGPQRAELRIDAGVTAPILLLDDFASELSTESQARLAQHLVRYRGQKFITSFEPPAAFTGHPARLFHVEQGKIGAVDGVS
jgi:DNA replication and repair protein RecF